MKLYLEHNHVLTDILHLAPVPYVLDNYTMQVIVDLCIVSPLQHTPLILWAKEIIQALAHLKALSCR